MNTTRLIYLCFFIGIGLWQHSSILYFFMVIKNRIIITRNLRTLTHIDVARSYGKMGNYIKMVLDASGTKGIFPTPEIFFIVTGTIMVGITWTLSLMEPLGTSLLFGSFLGSLPYLFIIARLNQQRTARSREGDTLIHELLNNYKIYDYNMREAVEMTVKTIEEAPHAKGILLDLSRGLGNAITAKEVNVVLDAFRYALDTTWGNALASCISFAHINGVRVDYALEDLANSITKSRQVIEHGKRENNEARLILTYLAPVSFLLSIVGACKYFGFTVGKFITYQFTTPTGLRWFLIMMSFYICGILINGFFSREKMDI